MEIYLDRWAFKTNLAIFKFWTALNRRLKFTLHAVNTQSLTRKLLQISSAILLIASLFLTAHANSLRSMTPKEVELIHRWLELSKLAESPRAEMSLILDARIALGEARLRGESVSSSDELKHSYNRAERAWQAYRDEMKLLDVQEKAIAKARKKLSQQYFIFAAVALFAAVSIFLVSRLKLPIRIQIG